MCSIADNIDAAFDFCWRTVSSRSSSFKSGTESIISCYSKISVLLLFATIHAARASQSSSFNLRSTLTICGRSQISCFATYSLDYLSTDAARLCRWENLKRRKTRVIEEHETRDEMSAWPWSSVCHWIKFASAWPAQQITGNICLLFDSLIASNQMEYGLNGHFGKRKR